MQGEENKTTDQVDSDFTATGLKYQIGLSGGNTEALEGALPPTQNNPQKCPFGLYAEQLSGTPFTLPRVHNQFSWLYRILPSAQQKKEPSRKSDYVKVNQFLSDFTTHEYGRLHLDPSQRRWSPIEYNHKGSTFIQGMQTMCGAGTPLMKNGIGMHVYNFDQNMENEAYYSSDGDMLIVPQEGTLYVTTEFGRLVIEQQEICVIQRGIKFQINLDNVGKKFSEEQLKDENRLKGRGWLCEIYKGHLQLPDLGPIGANSLAHPRHFQTPVSWYQDLSQDFRIINKFGGEFFEYEIDHSPFDVVAWHGSYAPYKYDLRKFNTIGSISYDHPDPSIFTVLTCQSDNPGEAILDFVIFPPRWLVAEGTFRPPWYHRNTMSEFMGNIKGKYDAKEAGFSPGASSLHSAMAGHGPESGVYKKASDTTNKQEPQFISPDGMAFMFETCFLMKLSDYAYSNNKDDTYIEHSWTTLEREFNPNKK